MTNGILSDAELAAMMPLESISNHPDPNIKLTRKCQFLSEVSSLEQKIITLRLLVTHYDLEGNYAPQTLPDCVFTITADTLHWVDPTQSTIPRVAASAPNAVREWDFWWNLLFNTNSETTQATILSQQIAAIDAAEGFNIYPTINYSQN